MEVVDLLHTAFPDMLAVRGTLAITGTLALRRTLVVAGTLAVTGPLAVAGAVGIAHCRGDSEGGWPRGHDPVALQVGGAPFIAQAFEVTRDRMTAQTMGGDVDRALLR